MMEGKIREKQFREVFLDRGWSILNKAITRKQAFAARCLYLIFISDGRVRMATEERCLATPATAQPQSGSAK